MVKTSTQIRFFLSHKIRLGAAALLVSHQHALVHVHMHSQVLQGQVHLGLSLLLLRGFPCISLVSLHFVSESSETMLKQTPFT